MVYLLLLVAVIFILMVINFKNEQIRRSHDVPDVHVVIGMKGLNLDSKIYVTSTINIDKDLLLFQREMLGNTINLNDLNFSVTKTEGTGEYFNNYLIRLDTDVSKSNVFIEELVYCLNKSIGKRYDYSKYLVNVGLVNNPKVFWDGKPYKLR